MSKLFECQPPILNETLIGGEPFKAGFNWVGRGAEVFQQGIPRLEGELLNVEPRGTN
jgi:hypothetical protein